MAFPTAYTTMSYGGGALPTTLTGTGISATATTFTVADLSTWLEQGTSNPLGTSGPFVVAIDYGQANEEKVLVAQGGVNLSTNTVTVYSSGGSVGRAYDDSNNSLFTTVGTGVSHALGAVVVPVFTGLDAKNANSISVNTLGKIAAIGDLLVGNGPNSVAKKAIGSSGQLLTVSGGDAVWQDLTLAQVPAVPASEMIGTGGSANQVLTNNGAGVAPVWAAPIGAWMNTTIADTTVGINPTITTNLSQSVSGYTKYLISLDMNITNNNASDRNAQIYIYQGSTQLTTNGTRVIAGQYGGIHVSYLVTGLTAGTSYTFSGRSTTYGSTGTLNNANLVIQGFN